MRKILIFSSSSILVLLLLAYIATLFTTLQPAAMEPAAVVCEKAPLMNKSTFRVLDYNVQYMAGKTKDFWYDGGTDIMPSAEDITRTTSEVARVIKEANPDFVLLQEINENDIRTYHRDELKELRELLGNRYPCYSEAFYWQADFVPHPYILGSVGMKLVTLSKFKINKAVRHQLPIPSRLPIHRDFEFKRALLETEIATKNATKNRDSSEGKLTLLNTHLDAWEQGTGIMQQQISKVDEVIKELEKQHATWLIGGDFNLLPPNHQVETLRKLGRSNYDKVSAIKVLFDQYAVIPTLEDLNSDNEKAWYTYLPNGKEITEPDRTIDYIFYSSSLEKQRATVKHNNTWKTSDHMPIIAEFSWDKK